LSIITIERIVAVVLVTMESVETMKKIACLILLVVMASFALGSVSGCQSTGSKNKKDPGLSKTTKEFFDQPRVR